MRRKRRRKSWLPLILCCMGLVTLCTLCSFVFLSFRLSKAGLPSRFRDAFSGEFKKQEEKKTLTIFTTVLEADVAFSIPSEE